MRAPALAPILAGMTDPTAEPKPNILSTPKRLPFRTLRAGARVTHTIFEMPASELHALEEQARIGPHTPPVHQREALPVGGHPKR